MTPIEVDSGARPSAPVVADTAQLLREAVAWVAARTDLIVPRRPRRSAGEAPDRDGEVERLKRLSELSIVVRLRHRMGGTAGGGAGWAPIDAAISSAIVGNVPLAAVLPAAQILTSPVALDPESARARARLVLLDDGFRQLYRDPATELCYRHLLAQTRAATTYFWHDLLPRLLSAVCAAPAALRRADVYAFTHEVFYLTDFGARRWPDALDIGVVRSVLHSQWVRARADGDDDLLLELFIVALVTGLATEALCADAYGVMHRGLRLGWFGRPHYSSLLADVLGVEARRRYTFDAQFHPTILTIAALLVVQRLAGAVAPPSDQPERWCIHATP